MREVRGDMSLIEFAALVHAEIHWAWALRGFVEEEGIAGHWLVSKFSRDAPKSLFP